MRSSWIVAILVIPLWAWGCAPTPYQKARAAFGHGYSDKRLSEDIFHVAFTANWGTSDDTMRRYLYRRVAELTVQHGFRYFTVIRGPRPLTEYRTEYRSLEDQQATLDSTEVEHPAWGTMHMTIQCFQDARQAVDMRPIDAMAQLPKNYRSGQG